MIVPMKSAARRGALVGAIVTAPFTALSYLGWKLLGVPFVPFDLFDWVARALPGPIVTMGIDLAVTVAQALPFRTADAAKTGEQLIAIVIVFGGGAAAGAALGGLRHASGESVRPIGAILGTVLGGLALLIERDLHRLPPGSIGSGIWVVSTAIAWGLGIGSLYERVRSDETLPHGPAAAMQVDARRQFLVRIGGAAALTSLAATVWGRLTAGDRPPTGERWSARHALPNAGAVVTAAPGTRPEFTTLEQHYRVDTNTRAPILSERDWRLQVGGLVDRPLALTLDDLRREVPLHQFVTLECISNPVGGDLIGTTRWTGVSLQRVLALVGRDPRATHLRITSADAFFETVALELIDRDPRVMLAYAWDGVALYVEHGFPLRLYVPDVYGMKQPKWITAIDLVDRFEPGYWVLRGWDRAGQMKAASAVDTVAIGAATTAADGRALITVGGIAHAGARLIEKVEVQVDDGAWNEARVRDPLSSTTWVVWRADIPHVAGEHTVTVRCVDGDGALQTDRLHRKRVRLS
jgi:DMSO/TMAO reductase YedYZ molybdopterin-dependent catalytic subunit